MYFVEFRYLFYCEASFPASSPTDSSPRESLFCFPLFLLDYIGCGNCAQRGREGGEKGTVMQFSAAMPVRRENAKKVKVFFVRRGVTRISPEKIFSKPVPGKARNVFLPFLSFAQLSLHRIHGDDRLASPSYWSLVHREDNNLVDFLTLSLQDGGLRRDAS